jgi:hypothetical protein
VDGLLELLGIVWSANLIRGISAIVEQKKVIYGNEKEFEDENYSQNISLHCSSRNNLGVGADVWWVLCCTGGSCRLFF